MPARFCAAPGRDCFAGGLAWPPAFSLFEDRIHIIEIDEAREENQAVLAGMIAGFIIHLQYCSVESPTTCKTDIPALLMPLSASFFLY